MGARVSAVLLHAAGHSILRPDPAHAHPAAPHLSRAAR
jgi:hypothetical protein